MSEGSHPGRRAGCGLESMAGGALREGGFYNRCVYLIQEELRKAQLRTERIEGVILPEFEKDMSSFTDLLNSMLADDYAECSQTLSAAECDSIIYHPLKLWNKCRLANEGSGDVPAAAEIMT